MLYLVLAIKKCCCLLERAVFGLDKVKIDKDELDHQPTDVHGL